MEEKTISERLGIRFTDGVNVEELPGLACTFVGTPRDENNKTDWSRVVFGFFDKATHRIIMVEGTLEELEERFKSFLYQFRPGWVRAVEDIIGEEAEELAKEIKLAREGAKEDDEKYDDDELLQEVYDSHVWNEIAEASEEVAEEIKEKALELVDDPEFGDD